MTEADALAIGRAERQEDEPLPVAFLDDEGPGEPPPFIPPPNVHELFGLRPGETVAHAPVRSAAQREAESDQS